MAPVGKTPTAPVSVVPGREEYNEEENDMAIDWTRPIETKDGRKCRMLCTDRKSSSHPVIVLVDYGDYEDARNAMLDGRFSTSSFMPDIRNVPEKFSREVWVNVYRNCVFGFTSKYDAVSHAERWLLACIRVPITGHVGQFDE